MIRFLGQKQIPLPAPHPPAAKSSAHESITGQLARAMNQLETGALQKLISLVPPAILWLLRLFALRKLRIEIKSVPDAVEMEARKDPA